MNILFVYGVIFAPIMIGLIAFFSRKLAPWLSLAATLATAVIAAMILSAGELTHPFLNLRAYLLSSGIFFAASVFALLINIYSIKFMSGKQNLPQFYAYFLITLGSCAGALFASDYLTLLLFWGMLAASLYMLVGLSGPKAASAAKKTLLIVGGSDALMVLAVAIIWALTKNLQIGYVKLAILSPVSALAFLCFLAGSLAKSGAMPLHSWIPACADVAEVPVMAYLPASLDKLIGIYLLFRLNTDIFFVSPNSAMSILLLTIGSVTIIAAVMGALVQHDLKKLLSYHAVSQVGYMVLGIGTALPVGIAGGLFHMINNTIYKSCLFLAGGSVEKQTGKTDLGYLGGLGSLMPMTFASAAIAALSISGVPPFNGFVSKWMIYQGVIGLAGTSRLWVIWLCAAMFGSALTLASFVKVIHAIFLGQRSSRVETSEVHPSMWVPTIILAAVCVIFGIFAYSLPLKYFILPLVPGVMFSGSWTPVAATGFLLLGLLAGLVFYWLGNTKKVTFKPVYIGGEDLPETTIKISPNEFYNSIIDFGMLKRIYKAAEKKYFDIYDMFKVVLFLLNRLFSWLHNGLVNTYITWMLVGAAILFLFLR